MTRWSSSANPLMRSSRLPCGTLCGQGRPAAAPLSCSADTAKMATAAAAAGGQCARKHAVPPARRTWMKRSACSVAHSRQGWWRTPWNRRRVEGLCPAAGGAQEAPAENSGRRQRRTQSSSSQQPGSSCRGSSSCCYSSQLARPWLLMGPWQHTRPAPGSSCSSRPAVGMSGQTSASACTRFGMSAAQAQANGDPPGTQAGQGRQQGGKKPASAAQHRAAWRKQRASQLGIKA